MIRRSAFLLLIGLAMGVASCGGNGGGSDEEEEGDPPEVVLGERLFLETRFAQAYFAAAGGQVNAPGPGDAVVDVTVTAGESLPGPFRGAAMNCRACHLVDEQRDTVGGGVRTYADFARRSPVPHRDEDAESMTPRNSPALVDSTLLREGPFFLHFDAEFASTPDLVRGTFTGRNFGWLANEQAQAIAHVANVVRGDDGRGALARDFAGLPYRVVITGTDAAIPPEFRLPPQYRLDVAGASDQDIFDAVANLVSAYVESLLFAQDPDGRFFASPYDTFLRKNGLPRTPESGESPADYSARLRDAVDALSEPRFVTPENGTFRLHAQEFSFAEQELQGLRIFLAVPETLPLPVEVLQRGGVGNCVSCHPAPTFTDFRFHNTGAAQDEYDVVHGPGTFMALEIPGLVERNASPDEFLPPAADHPLAAGRFRAIPSVAHPGWTDLGVWNVLGNPAIPGPQATLTELLCSMQGLSAPECNGERLLPTTIGLFKTPGLRDLGQSAPYLHTGQKDALEEVVDFYGNASVLARVGRLRNPAPELQGMALIAADRTPLAAFLRALNEDYE